MHAYSELGSLLMMNMHACSELGSLIMMKMDACSELGSLVMMHMHACSELGSLIMMKMHACSELGSLEPRREVYKEDMDSYGSICGNTQPHAHAHMLFFLKRFLQRSARIIRILKNFESGLVRRALMSYIHKRQG